MARSAPFLAVAVALAWAAGAAAQDVKTAPPQRLVLVSSSSSDHLNNLLDLAHAKISAERDVALLERKAIAKILAEQKLSVSGLVDGNLAVKVGKLLTANTIALIEADALGKEALGLRIFDAETGVKWHDRALAAGSLDKQVEAVLAAVRAVSKKRAAGPQPGRTVCILSARNADLPRTHDHVGPTVAWLLERHLLMSPSLAVLERSRLDWLNQEKALPEAGTPGAQKPAPGTHKELLAALVTVEVEIGRAAKGIRATAHLSNAKGEDLGKIEAESGSANAEELARGMLAGIVRILQAEPTAAFADRLRESQRFFVEGQRLTSHKHWRQAIAPLETALALDPDQRGIRNDLAKALLVWSSYLLQGHPDLVQERTKTGIALTPDLVKQALAAGLRGYELRKLSLEKCPATLAGLQSYDVFFRATDHKLSPFNLKFVLKEGIDDEGRALRTQVFAAHVRMAGAELNHWGKAVEKGPASESSQAFRIYVVRLTTFIRELQLADFHPAADVETISLEWLERWRQLSQTPKLALHPYDVNWLLKESFDQALRLAPHYEELAKHADPLVRLWGRYLLLSVRRRHGQIPPEQADQAYQDIKRSALQTMEKYQPPVKTPASVHEDLRHACYEFLWQTTKRWPYGKAQDRFHDRLALCQAMLGRKELVTNLLLETLQKDSAVKEPFHSERWKLIQQALALLDAGTPALCDNPAFVRHTLAEIQAVILRERPEFADLQKQPAAPAPWKKARQLVRPAEIPQLLQMGPPLVQGKHVLLPISRFTNPRRIHIDAVELEVLKVSWQGKDHWEKWARCALPADPSGKPTYNAIRCACWGDGRYFLGTQQGILIFDDKGAVRFLHKEIELPAAPTDALAYVQGKLYAVLEGGYVIALDPETKKFEVLASSRRRERLSPFDDGEAFRVSALLDDAPRQRLLLVVNQKPNAPEEFGKDRFPKDNMNGLWEYDLKTKKFTRQLALYFNRVNSASAVQPGSWLLSHTANDDVFSFNLKTNQAHIVLGTGVLGPELRRLSPPRQQPAFPFYQYAWQHDGHLWAVTPRALDRVSLKDGRVENLPSLASTSAGPVSPPWAWCGLERLGPNQLLLQNATGLWLLEMPAP